MLITCIFVEKLPQMSFLGPLGHWNLLPFYCLGLFFSAIFFSFQKCNLFSFVSAVVYWKTWERGQASGPPRASTEALFQHAVWCSKAPSVFSPVESRVFRVIHSNGCGHESGVGSWAYEGFWTMRLNSLQQLFSHLLLGDNRHGVALGLSLYAWGLSGGCDKYTSVIDQGVRNYSLFSVCSPQMLFYDWQADTAAEAVATPAVV